MWFVWVATAYGGLSDLEQIRPQGDGRFTVVCAGGLTETVSGDELRQGRVCGSSSRSSSGTLLCEPNGGGGEAALTRIADGAELGWPVPLATCTSILAASTHGLLCEPNNGGGGAILTRIADGAELGWPVSLATCTSILAASTPELLCKPNDGGGGATLTRIADGAELGWPMPTETCLRTIPR